MKYVYIILVVVGVMACVPLTQSSTNSDGNPKDLQLIDQTYEPQIRTVQLSPVGIPMQPAVTALGQWNLLLTFDDLKGDRDNYLAKIIHCNFDWSKSSLQDLDFLTDYNEFPINNFEPSVNTHIPYVHYWYNLPAVKLPGNYVLVVYRSGNEDDIVLSRRFMVFDNKVTFKREGNLVGPSNMADLNQQINFTINHSNLYITNPLLDVHVNMRQNQRWDNMAVDMRPSFIRDIEKELDYRYFDDANMFKAGNEFRFFDLRSLYSPGRYVNRVNKNVKPFEVYIDRDRSRNGSPYSIYVDQNGGYTIDNYDYRQLPFTNYAYVNFSLYSPVLKNTDVFVTGAFNSWNMDRESQMRYDSAQQSYTARVLLKQGLYDYQYVTKSKTVPPYYFEGTNFQTENFYEVFVYYRALRPNADLLVGYVRLEKSTR
ncbi:MAG TPA: DUF5103 domain-containing protein [Chryseolinea sp.]|nr:DUF5103 domain-containing protein [Chryseolinea sp.]